MAIIDILKSVAALGAVLGLIGLLAAFLRRGASLTAFRAKLQARRLAVVESMGLDSRRRVVILRCDGREHLILLSATGETLISSDLGADASIETDAPVLREVAA